MQKRKILLAGGGLVAAFAAADIATDRYLTCSTLPYTTQVANIFETGNQSQPTHLEFWSEFYGCEEPR